MENIKVGVRLRPLTPLEIEKGETEAWELDEGVVTQIGGKQTCTVACPRYSAALVADNHPLLRISDRFNHNYGPDATNRDIYDSLVRGIVESGMQGINGTCFAYGQTASGTLTLASRVLSLI